MLETLDDESAARKLTSACEEQMWNAAGAWKGQLQHNQPVVNFAQQQNLIVDLQTAIERGCEPTLRWWADLARTRKCTSSDFVAVVKRLAGNAIAELIEFVWKEATSGRLVASSDVLPLGLQSDFEVFCAREGLNPREVLMDRLRAVADRKLPFASSGLRFNMRYLRKLAEVHKENLDLPGVRAVRVQLSPEESRLRELAGTRDEIDEYLDTLLPALKRETIALIETLSAKAFESPGSRAEVEQSPAASAVQQTEALQHLGADRSDESEQRLGSRRENGSSSSAPSKATDVEDPFATRELRLAMVDAAVKKLESKRKLAKAIRVDPKKLYEWIATGNVATKSRSSSLPGRIEDWLKNYLN